MYTCDFLRGAIERYIVASNQEEIFEQGKTAPRGGRALTHQWPELPAAPEVEYPRGGPKEKAEAKGKAKAKAMAQGAAEQVGGNNHNSRNRPHNSLRLTSALLRSCNCRLVGSMTTPIARVVRMPIGQRLPL